MDPSHRLAILALLLTGVGSLAPAQAQLTPQESRKISAFRRAFAAKPGRASLPAMQDAMRELARVDHAKATAAMIEAFCRLEQAAEPIREKRRAILMRGGGSKALIAHRRALQPLSNLQERILEALARQRAPEAVGTMLRSLIVRRQRLPLRLEIALARRAGDVSERDLAPLLQATRGTKVQKKAEIALPLLTALARAGRRGAAAAPWAIRQLESKSADVRIRAAQALAALCVPSALEPMIGRLALEEGRAQDAVFAALEELTGASVSRSASAWRQWLAAEGGPYLDGTRPLGRRPSSPNGRQSGRPGRRGPGRAKVRGPGKSTGSYFGIPQDGQGILYVFDNSNSMKAAMPGQRKIPKEQRKTRMDRCKEELHRALNQLTPEKTFNLLAFANRLRAFEPVMQPATKANLKRAHAWIDALELEFQTNVHDALEQAFNLAGRGAADRYYALTADTIFVLSDGAPTIPKSTGRGIQRDSIPEILAAVRGWNPLGRLVVHTIGLGVGAGPRAAALRGFMGDLASQNGGQAVFPK